MNDHAVEARAPRDHILFMPPVGPDAPFSSIMSDPFCLSRLLEVHLTGLSAGYSSQKQLSVPAQERPSKTREITCF